MILHLIMQPTLIYITCPNREEAILLSRELLGEKLIACANIIDHVTSLYWWDGHIDQNNECVIVTKTLSTCVQPVIEWVTQHHSYQCPAIVSIPITEGNPEYIEWIKNQIHS